MNPLVFLAKQLVIGVIGSQVSKSRERQRNNNIKHIKGYYLSIFNNSFTMEESIWISSRKIEPMLSRMSNKEIENTVSLIIKNKKRAQKNKLIKKRLIDEKLIEQYHIEYKNFLTEEKRKQEEDIRRQEENERNRLRNIQMQKRYKAYILENGENEADIAKKFF